MPKQDERKPFSVAFAVDDWRFALNGNTGKFEACRANRPDLAHLTIAWGTTSGELDVHLTYQHEQAMVGGTEKGYESVLRISKNDLVALGARADRSMLEVLGPHVLRSYRQFRPGWLARNGYYVTLANEGNVRDWLVRGIPKSRGKFRFHPGKLLDLANIPSEFSEEIYDPRVLHFVEEDPGIPVLASRVWRGKVVAGDNVMLGRRTDQSGWWGVTARDARSIANRILGQFFDWAIPLVRPEHAAKFELIVRGLGLEEAEATFVFNMRQFLAHPRNPVSGPYPR